jgi:hypothetical protein
MVKLRAQMAFNYVRTTWPYWERKNGSDHIIFYTNDNGEPPPFFVAHRLN